MAAKIELSCSAVKAMQRIGVCSEQVTLAVQAPDDVHKIIPQPVEQREWPVISLYVKRFFDGNKESLLLVQALKQRGSIVVSDVWQIYPGIIGVDESTCARDVFEAFLDKYGVQLRTSCGLTKLVTYKVVGSSTTTRHGKWEQTYNVPEKVLDAEDHRVSETPDVYLSKWAKEMNVKMQIAMLYGINLSNYLYDLSNYRSLIS